MKLNKVIFVALLAVLAACAFGSCDTSSQYVGTYESGTCTIVLRENGSCTLYSGVYSSNSSVTQKDSGTWSVSGSTITFSWSNTGAQSASINAGKSFTITVDSSSQTFYWQRAATTIVS